MFVQDVADGERDDDGVLAAEEAVDLAECVVRVVEADEEALLAPGPHHGSLELINIGAADSIDLLHLNGKPVVHKAEFVNVLAHERPCRNSAPDYPLGLLDPCVYLASIVELTNFSYRFGSEVLDSAAFADKKADIIEILTELKKDVPQLTRPKKVRARGAGKIFTTDQRALNAVLDELFRARGWECQPPVTNDKVTKLKADYKKERVQVEVQFGNMARWYTDVFKFQVSYSLGMIDVGVLVVPMHDFANTIDENVAHYERVTRELPYAKMSLTLPIWVIGIRP